MPALPWVDWALIAVLALSVLAGLMRGLVFELMSLLGWLVAWFAAQWFAPQLAPHLPVGASGSALNMAAAFTACFLGALIAWGLLAKLFRMIVQATPLSLIDRALGAVFGLLRGAVLLLAVVTVVALTPAAKSPSWRQSQGALWLNTALHGLKPVLPSQLAGLLPV
jgi:membrane protein required for colicin V production